MLLGVFSSWPIIITVWMWTLRSDFVSDFSTHSSTYGRHMGDVCETRKVMCVFNLCALIYIEKFPLFSTFLMKHFIFATCPSSSLYT